MKKMYILLLGLLCSASVIAQTTEWTDVASENITAEGMMTENMLLEEGVQTVISEELMATIQQDCQSLAQYEEVQEEQVSNFVEACIADNVEMEQTAVYEEIPETGVATEEYAEVFVGEMPDPTVTE